MDHKIGADNNANTEYEITASGISKAVGQGLAVMQIENENQRQIALQKPRTLAKVYKEALQELELVPEFAAKAYYSIPYKNEMGGTTYVEGPSIKAAMSLCRLWGNCSNGGRIVDQNEDRIIVEGVFIDYETGFRTLRQVSVARSYWSKQTKRVIPLREDRLNMSIQAGISKAVRNAILASLPVSLIESYNKKAKEIATQMIGQKTMPNKLQPIKDRFAKAKDMFIKLGVTDQQWEDYLAGSSLQEDDLLSKLVGLYNSIEDGQTTIEAIFGSTKMEEPIKDEQVKLGDVFKNDEQRKEVASGIRKIK